MRDVTNVDKTKDLSTDRKLELDNGNQYHVVQRESCPFGFWYINMESGQIPRELKGRYTSATKAYTAITDYLSNSKSHRTIVKVKEK